MGSAPTIITMVRRPFLKCSKMFNTGAMVNGSVTALNVFGANGLITRYDQSDNEQSYLYDNKQSYLYDPLGNVIQTLTYDPDAGDDVVQEVGIYDAWGESGNL